MTSEEYENKLRIKANKIGYSEEEIQKCLIYSIPLLRKNLPIIYNTSNLSALVGYNKQYLKRAALRTDAFYRNFTILKRNGQIRKLKEPLPSLKEIQSWILENILYKIPISKYAKAYIPKKGIQDNVRYHKNRDLVITLDIVDFFSMIKRTSIEKIFLQCGYSSNVANLLSKLCCCDDQLPQGAATSPCLSNIYLRSFDELVAIYCNDNGIRYTRYADDLTFSGTLDSVLLISFISIQLSSFGLELNLRKTRIRTQHQRQIVTGIIVNKIIQVPKDVRKKIRQEVHYIKKLGLHAHLHNIKNTKDNYLYHLLGKINYASFINPKDKALQEYKEFLYSIIKTEQPG